MSCALCGGKLCGVHDGGHLGVVAAAGFPSPPPPPPTTAHDCHGPPVLACEVCRCGMEMGRMGAGEILLPLLLDTFC